MPKKPLTENLTFTVHSAGQPDRIYRGFTNIKHQPRSELAIGQHVALAWFDGELDVWLVEGATAFGVSPSSTERGVQEIKRYYIDDFPDAEKRLTIVVLAVQLSAQYIRDLK